MFLLTNKIRQTLVYGVILMIAVFSTGAHLAALQLVANGCMMVKYSQVDGVEEGVRKALDGQHPCGMCQMISDVKKSEAQERNGALKDVLALKFRLIPFERFFISPPCSEFQKFSDMGDHVISWADDILVPPPRLS